MDPHSRAPKKNTSHGNEVLPQDTTHLIQKPSYQRGSLCQDPAGNQTTQRPPDHCKETQTAVVWSCLLLIRSGQNHLTRHSERPEKARKTTTKNRWEDNISEWTGLEFAKSQRAAENNNKKMEETGCEIICGAPTTLAVKGSIMMRVGKSFDRVWHAALWTTTKKYYISSNHIRVIKNLWFRTTVGVDRDV